MMQVNWLVIVWEFTGEGTGAILKRNAPGDCAMSPLCIAPVAPLMGFPCLWLTTKLLDLCVFCFSQGQYG